MTDGGTSHWIGRAERTVASLRELGFERGRSVGPAGIEACKALILVNGGAILGILTFAGNAKADSLLTLNLPQLFSGVGILIGGLVLSVAASYLQWLSASNTADALLSAALALDSHIDRAHALAAGKPSSGELPEIKTAQTAWIEKLFSATLGGSVALFAVGALFSVTSFTAPSGSSASKRSAASAWESGEPDSGNHAKSTASTVGTADQRANLH